jgi:glutamine amidotransferase
MIVVVDYKMGNVGSILNMLKKIGAPALLSSDVSDIERADKLILPGVGAFDHGMERIHELDLLPALNAKALVEKTPVLGICLGMQLFGRGSEEGVLPGLGWLECSSVKFRSDADQPGLKIPHMGWNRVEPKHDASIFKGLEEDHGFYFVHSYHVVCERAEDVLATAHYGHEIVASVQRGNLLGTQFHPEKSHKHGLRLLKSFTEMR